MSAKLQIYPEISVVTTKKFAVSSLAHTDGFSASLEKVCHVCTLPAIKPDLFFVLSRVPPVFALHFVEGLPDNDVTIYTFNFKGKRYSVTTVIQYNQHLKHFVTWVCQSDGRYLKSHHIMG